MIPLPIVTNCDNCGVCCMHMGTPPMFAAAFPPDGHQVPEWFIGCDDWRIIQSMPEAVRAELAEYYRRVDAGEIEDRTARDDMPCLWFDLATRRCRHHEHRPTICREFEIGSEDCVRMRAERGIAEAAR